MADGVLVIFLLAIIWAAVLIPPAAGARASREAEFLGSIRPGGHPHEADARTGEFPAGELPRFRPALTANARRRQVLGGLVVAIGATLVLGLVPSFRLLLVVHLLLVNSCLAYVGLLVHARDEQAARTRVAATAAWRSDRSPADSDAGFDEPVHPYAYASTSSSAEFEYGDEDAISYPEGDDSYDAGGHIDDAYAGDAYAGEAYAGEGAYEGDAYGGGESLSDDDWDADDEAVAAYLDEELALRRPA